MLNIKVGLFVDRALDSLLHKISILGMNSLKYQLQRGFSRSILSKDVVRFLRPVDFSTRNVPAETASAANTLRLNQEIVTAVQVRIELGVLQRNRGLRSQHLQHRESFRRERARSQIVLQIECANECRLLYDGQTQDGSGALRPHILILRVQVRDRSIIKNHARPRPDHVMKHGLGDFRWRDGCPSNRDVYPFVAGDGLCLDLRLITTEKDEQSPLRPGMLDRDSHQLLN